MAELKTSEILTKAKARIDRPEKWCKRTYTTFQGRCCTVAALAFALNIRPTAAETCKQARYLRQCLPCPGALNAFNDRSSTTHDDVMALFDRAIAERIAAGD